jgi:O-phosphoseryl-tRNA(Sec) kinase
MNQFILALCGLPASGKSALADAIQKAMKSKVEIVRTDDWRDNEYYTDWMPEKEGPVRQKALRQVKNLVAEGRSVIHDDTNYYTSMRHELFEVALENECGFVIIHVTTPVTTALQWNKEREDSPIPGSVIEGIFERFDSPGRRYLWDNAELEVDMETQEISVVLAQILDILDNLEPVMKPGPSLVTDTEFERLDSETRRIVSEFLHEHPELRGNREVTVIRRCVLRTASERNTPFNEVNETLIAELNKLLR